MGNEKLKKFINDLLAEKRDMVFTRMDQVTNDIIIQLEKLKELRDFVQYEIPAGLEITGKAPKTAPINILHRYVLKISLAANQLDLITNFLEGVNFFCARAALFLFREDKLVGWKGKGFSGKKGEIGDEEIKKVFFSLSANTLFKYVLEKEKGYFGPPAPQPDDHLIYSRLGGKSPREVLALPFFVKGKPQAVIYADVFGETLIGKKEIEILATIGEMSLDLLPLRQKILAKVKTQKYFDDEAEEAEAVKEFVPVPIVEDEDQTLPSIKENDPERLARVIVNDIYLYNKEKVDQALKEGENLFDSLQNTILQSRELYLNKFTDLSPFERQLIKTLAQGKKDALKGYNFETM
ncbi:MAG: hypothetical protein JSV88_25230 [Candidatus Aminicenantes bacterium]|nr:MAG: hypothetical protein JSV88_25230 [Candidatus Aminicenantes bacterium]